MFSFEHRHHAFVPILCGFPSPGDKTRTLPARDLLISKAASSASASFSGAQSQHPNVPGLRADAPRALRASAPAVTSFEHERRRAPAAKGSRYSEAGGRRRAARRSTRILGRARRRGSGRTGSSICVPNQARHENQGPIGPLSSGTVRASINRATLLRAAPLPSPVEPDAIPPALRRPEHRPNPATARKPCSRWKRGRRSERHSIGRRQRRFGPERNRWTRRQGRHRSRLRDTRASGGVRLPKKDGRRTGWNQP